MAKLYDDTNSLYRLDQIQTVSGGNEDLGPLPMTSKMLLGGLVFVWICIIGYVVKDKMKKKN